MRAPWAGGALLATVGLFIAGCSSAAPTQPAGRPATAPLASDQAVKAASEPEAKAQATDQWEQIVTAAKQEGRLVLVGGAGADLREGSTHGFQEKYPGIEVEYSGMQGPTIAPRLLTQMQAGQNLTDLVMTGTTTVLGTLLPAGAVEPIHPYLVGPDAREQSPWRGGKFHFADEAGQYNLVFNAFIKSAFAYNSELASSDEFKSYRDLLDPKWKGKIAMLSPLQAGGGLANATFWYTTEALGKEYIRQLFTQDITILTDNRQLLDLVARGQYPIAMGASDPDMLEAIRKGLPVKLMPGEALKEGSYMTSGNGTAAVVKNPPHPNALKLYLNYLLSKQGQLEWSKGSANASLRRDVPHDHVFDYMVPREGVQYQENYAERFVKLREEVTDFLKSVMPS